MLAALPWHCTDSRRHSYGLLCVLPGGKELTDYGLLQKSDSSGTCLTASSSLVITCITGQVLSLEVSGDGVKCILPNTNRFISRWPKTKILQFSDCQIFQNYKFQKVNLYSCRGFCC